MGVPEEEKEKKAESLFKETIAENFSNLERDMDIQEQKAQRTPSKIHPKNYNETL